MKPDYRDALRLALEKGGVGQQDSETWNFINASPIPDLREDHKRRMLCSQEHRSVYLALKDQGYRTVHPGDGFDPEPGSVMFLLGRNRIWNRLDAGSRLIVAGNKKDGITSFRKWFSQYSQINDSLSKHHAVVFWADKSHKSAIEEQELVKQAENYWIAEGMFSSSGPDIGSKLLVEHFDSRIKGKIADLGAGWGFLSAELLKRSAHVDRLELFEADHRSLDFAKRNLAGFNIDDDCFHWCDVTTEFAKKPYDWVIMNPPFHSGRAAEPGLGQRFIEVAASTLPRGGRLLMVANRNLPYERTLSEKFRDVRAVRDAKGFKVLEALK